MTDPASPTPARCATTPERRRSREHPPTTRVFARHIGNRRLGDAIYRWPSPHYGDYPAAVLLRQTARRVTGKTHGQALRALGNKLIGQLDGCIRHNVVYDESYAWRDQPAPASA